jgi:glycosyltransferase involved in cell wall biosynthesis
MEEVIAFLAYRLPSLGLETAVLCTSPDAIVDGQLTGRTVQLLRSKGVEVFGAEPRQALEWAKQWRPDVMSAHGAPAWAFGLAGQLGVPYIDNLHSWNGLIGRDWRWHSQGAHSGSLAGVVAVSDLLRQQQLAVNTDFPPERIVTIPNGVDNERFRLVDREAVRDWLGLSEEYLFVSLGRYCMQKNSYGLITAFGDVAANRPELHLAIAGKIDEPRYYRRVLQLRDTMACRERIHLREHVLTPAQLLAAADGFVLDSFFEGWPLASMEALVAGLPVIIADVSGAREQIAGEPARGYVVANPLGDPLKADWPSSAAAQYRPQTNREELTAAMELLVANRDDYLCNRDRLTAESVARFSSASWLARHAAVLRAAAQGAAMPDTWALPHTVETSH